MPDQIIKQALRDFVATSNSGKYSDEKTLLSKFPELKSYDVQALKDFVATSNSGKYKSEDELFSKFPEFEAKKKVSPLQAPSPSSATPSFSQYKEQGYKQLEKDTSIFKPQLTNIQKYEEALSYIKKTHASW